MIFLTMSTKTENVKVAFMAELLYWIKLDCTGVNNEVDGECRFSAILRVHSH